MVTEVWDPLSNESAFFSFLFSSSPIKFTWTLAVTVQHTTHITAKMSDMKASVTETKAGFHVEGYEKIEYDFTFTDNVFDKNNGELAKCFERWQRCLAIMDLNIFELYGTQMQAYFEHHGLELKIHKTMIGEKAKSIETFLSIVDSMNEFGSVPCTMLSVLASC